MLKIKISSIRLISCMAFVFFCFNLYSAEDHNIKHLSTQNGLSNNYITSICQDNLGFIWFGTRDGLNRWDGKNTVIFRNEASNPNSLPDNFIRSLAADQEGNIWIGTNEAGAIKYNNETEKFTAYPVNYNDDSAFVSNNARIIHKQNDSLFWFGTSLGLVYYDSYKECFTRVFLQKENAKQNTPEIIISIFKINDEVIGVQSNIGIFEIKDFKAKAYSLPKALDNSSAILENNPIFVAHNGDFWFADPDVLYHYKNDGKEPLKHRNIFGDEKSISSNDISGIYEDSQNNLWVITWDGGANRFDYKTQTFTRFIHNDDNHQSLSDNIVTGIFEDSFENLWLITEEGGANFFTLKQNRMRFYSHQVNNSNSLTNNKVGTFFTNDDGNVLIGTGNATISDFDPVTKSITQHTIKKNNYAATVLGIKKINRSNYYVGGWGLGLCHYNIFTEAYENVLKAIPALNYNKTVHENISSFNVDAKGFVWLSSHSSKGLMVYNPIKNEVYDAKNPGPIMPDLVNIPYPGYIYIDRNDQVWITSYSGLYMYDGDELYEFSAEGTQNMKISSNYVYTVYEDNEGNIWVGSSGGLDKISMGGDSIWVEKFNTYDQSIPNNIKNIIGDDKNRLWLSYTNGIIRLNVENKETRFFHVNSNASVLEFSERTCAKTKSGDLYFGTTNGFLTFHPDSMEMVKEEIPIYFTEFRLFNKSQKVNGSAALLNESILYTDTLYLKHKQNAISIEFTPLAINSEEQIEYEYMLKGVDKLWVEAGENRLITYANIMHGNYEFTVRAKSKDASKLSSQNHIFIIIKPPFWKTKLAYFFYLLLFILIFYAINKIILNREKLKNDLKLQKIKIQNVQETNLMKLRFFTNISHEFRTPLTLIKVPLEKLISQYNTLRPEEHKYQLDLMLNSTNRLDKMVNQLMDYRKMEAGSLLLEPSVGNLTEFCKSIYESFKLLAQQKQLKYFFSFELESILIAFDADKLEKIITNLLSNAFKNTPPGGRVEFNIEQESSQQVKLSIIDTGYGIPEENLPYIFDRFYMVKSTKNVAGTGIGLALTKELVDIHQGQIFVVSEVNKGTTFTIHLPTNIEVNNASKQNDNELQGELNEPDEELNSDSNIRILVIDDDADMLKFLTHELSLAYHVITATNGAEGIEVAKREKPQLILSDVMMPNVDGIELCETLKKDELTSHIPIILLTAQQSDEKKIEGLVSGANAYLMKPFNLEILNLTISNILNNSKKLFEAFKTDSGFFFEDKSMESSDQTLMQQIIDLVLENLTNNKINADFIAKRIFVSRTVLYLKIEALTGQTVNEFIASIRLKKAKQLLLNPEINISEVSFAVGYASQSYFSRSFTKAFGCSPRKYISDNLKE